MRVSFFSLLFLSLFSSLLVCCGFVLGVLYAYKSADGSRRYRCWLLWLLLLLLLMLTMGAMPDAIRHFGLTIFLFFLCFPHSIFCCLFLLLDIVCLCAKMLTWLAISFQRINHKWPTESEKCMYFSYYHLLCVYVQ